MKKLVNNIQIKGITKILKIFFSLKMINIIILNKK